ncbi:hypothetical protein NDU88_001153 [Pleurodeles waltl]|uniref:Uncharacterized protein n=1 Tax=Pleurodeles waltl TaxID=8319 RepID=A0AAV7Q2A0_PLEWA|nr:hypothetical protein NDU88_001153 [Pleurodeles waltl]
MLSRSTSSSAVQHPRTPPAGDQPIFTLPSSKLGDRLAWHWPAKIHRGSQPNGGRGQATKHGECELLELRAPFGLSGISGGNRGDNPLPDRLGWGPGDSVTRRSGKLALGGPGGRAKPQLCGPDPWARPQGGSAAVRRAAEEAGADGLDRGVPGAPPSINGRDLGGGGGPRQRNKGGERAVRAGPFFENWWWARVVSAGPLVEPWGPGDFRPAPDCGSQQEDDAPLTNGALR